MTDVIAATLLTAAALIAWLLRGIREIRRASEGWNTAEGADKQAAKPGG